MTLASFKERIAKRYETYSDNIIVIINDKQYGNADIEETLMLYEDLGIDENKVVKFDFVIKP